MAGSQFINDVVAGKYLPPAAQAQLNNPSVAPQSSPNTGSGGAAYWVGADGNVYLKSGAGGSVKSYGKASNLSANGFDTPTYSAQAVRINDPNAPASSAPANPNGTTGGSALPDNTQDINFNNAGLAGLDIQNQSGLAAIDKSIADILGGYDSDSSANEKNYTDSSNTNQNNLDKNTQTALVNAAQGRRGLSGVLASLGALNGSGIVLRDRAVQKGANDDLAGADDNFKTNQSGLDTSIGTFRNEDAARRKDLDTQADNARTNVKNAIAKSRQGYYTNLTKDYSEQGDNDSAKKYSDLAASLFPEIASTSIPSTNIQATPAAYTPATLSSYLAGNGSTTVKTTPAIDGSQPGLVATTAKRKLVTA